MRRLTLLLFPLASCAAQGPLGYDPASPTHLTCPCDDGNTCYESAAKLDEDKGENAATAEQLMVFAQCACFEGTMAGCNTIAHFAKDAVAACDAGDDIKTSCAIAGYVYRHGVIVPPVNGRSFDHDPAAAKAAFARACEAGGAEACAASKPPR